jgi:hypothetical protein
LDRFVSVGKRVRPLVPDLVGTALAVAFAWPLLLYPFGRDQGLYHYVGREWFRGLVPYRDLMEQKTPLIYFLYGLVHAVFGEHYYSIRIFELAFVLVLGWMLARLAAPRGHEPLPGLRGACALALAMAYVGLFRFWDTGQCEIWAVGLALASLTVVERRGSSIPWLIVAGALGGLAILGKPTAILFDLVAAGVAVEHALRRATAERRASAAATATMGYFVGLACVLVASVVYFAAQHALADAYDVLVRCNAYYLRNEAGVHTASETGSAILWGFGAYRPIALVPPIVVACGVIAGIRARSWQLLRRYVILCAIGVAAIGGIAAQRKFFIYHWPAYVSLAAVAFAFATDDVARWLASRVRGARHEVVVVGAMAVFVVAYGAGGDPMRKYRESWTASYEYARGRLARAAYLDVINVPGYDLQGPEVVGHWIEANSRPDDIVDLRDFEPSIYLIAHRRAATRFFWTPWIAWSNRAYRRAEWLAQDEAARRLNPPRYVVTVARIHDGPESPGYYKPEYQERFRYHEFVVMERSVQWLDAEPAHGSRAR